MPEFGKKSLERLRTCHPDIQLICEEVILIYDFSVLEGSRTLERQNELFQEGKSKLDGIHNKSKHQVSYQQPYSMAVDIAPYPVKWEGNKAKARFYMLAGYMFATAEYLYSLGTITHKLRWGGDWDSDKNFEDQSFDDLPHMELVKG